METYKDFIGYIEETVKAHWDLDALTDYKGSTLQYKDVARKIEKLHIMFENAGIQKGDRIALCGRNCANWAVAFLATLSYGAVAVPILHEFKPEQVHGIVNHSEARLLFVGDQVWPSLNADEMPHLEGIISNLDYALLVSRTEKLTEAREHLNEFFGRKYPKNFRAEHVGYRHTTSGDDLALINYTSGTTSNSKGVLIPYRALWSNLLFAREVLGDKVKCGDPVISMLPLAHMYGMAFEFLFEFMHGCHVYYLTRVPSPKIIFMAFADIKPVVVVSVPLIIEKIIKKSVLPKLQTPSMKLLLKLPLINARIREKSANSWWRPSAADFTKSSSAAQPSTAKSKSFYTRQGSTSPSATARRSAHRLSAMSTGMISALVRAARWRHAWKCASIQMTRKMKSEKFWHAVPTSCWATTKTQRQPKLPLTRTDGITRATSA